jgi:GNAT superfamily N-acetyltransferase
MREDVCINSKPFIFFTPENNDQFEAILDLTRAIHGEGAVALCRSLDAGLPGMCRDDWYGLVNPDDWPDGMSGPARVVSTLCRVPASWTCSDAGIEVQLPVAELGMVASAEDARGLGLSSWLMKRFKADSIKAGYPLSAIQGIPYFYRRFGYEYAVPLIPKIVLSPGQVSDQDQPRERGGLGTITETSSEKAVPLAHIVARKATDADIPLMSVWFTEISSKLGIRADRRPEHWEYLLGKSQLSFETAVDRRILLDGQGKPIGWLGFQRDCFGPTLAIAEASLPDTGKGWSAQAMLAYVESIRAEEGLPHITVLLPRTHPLAIAAAESGGELCREYAWQVALLDRQALLNLLRPLLEARLIQAGWLGRAQRFGLDLYAGGLRFDWDGERLEITGIPAPGKLADTNSSGEGVDTMPEMPVSSFPPELLGPLVLGYRSWQELGHCRRDVLIRPEDRSFLDDLFPVMDSFIYPLF